MFSSNGDAFLFLLTRDEGYAREITRFFDNNLSEVQKQLDKFESGGVLISRMAGRTRLYRSNPRYPFLQKLKAVLEKVLSFGPEDGREALQMGRRRPRGRGKPL